MRRVFAITVLAAFAAGCGRPADTVQAKDIRDKVLLHFSRLNQEAELARIEAKTHPLSDLDAPEGRQYNTFFFHPDGLILEDIECPRCRARQTVVAYHGEVVLCGSCGSADKTGKVEPLIGKEQAIETFGDQAKPMLEVRKDSKALGKDKLVIVRYVRKHWLLDENARVALQKSPEVQELAKGVVGFHRLDASFVCTTAFLYDGSLTQIDTATVRKIMKGEMPERKTWTFGAAGAVEEPVRPWNAPGHFDNPKLRSY